MLKGGLNVEPTGTNVAPFWWNQWFKKLIHGQYMI